MCMVGHSDMDRRERQSRAQLQINWMNNPKQTPYKSLTSVWPLKNPLSIIQMEVSVDKFYTIANDRY